MREFAGDLGTIGIKVCVLLKQGADLLAILLGAAVAKLLFESLAQCVDVAVLAEDEREHEPIITRAYLTIFAMVASKVRTAHRVTSELPSYNSHLWLGSRRRRVPHSGL